jgi:hypothetical protein
MTEEVKLARLWSGFHRLSVDDRTLVLKFAEAIPRSGKPDKREIPVEKPMGRDPSWLEEEA